MKAVEAAWIVAGVKTKLKALKSYDRPTSMRALEAVEILAGVRTKLKASKSYESPVSVKAVEAVERPRSAREVSPRSEGQVG